MRTTPIQDLTYASDDMHVCNPQTLVTTRLLPHKAPVCTHINWPLAIDSGESLFICPQKRSSSGQLKSKLPRSHNASCAPPGRFRAELTQNELETGLKWLKSVFGKREG
jgi:hypothetical protein